MATRKNQTKTKKLPRAKLAKVTWEIQSQLGVSVIIGKKKLVALMSKDPSGGYMVIAVETEGAGINSVLAKHAHQVVGNRASIRDAMTLVEEFAARWVQGQGAGPPVELCHCKSIVATPQRTR